MENAIDRYFPKMKGNQKIISIDSRDAQNIETKTGWTNDNISGYSSGGFIEILKAFLKAKKDLKMVIGAPFGTGKSFLSRQLTIKFASEFNSFEEDYVAILINLGSTNPFNNIYGDFGLEKLIEDKLLKSKISKILLIMDGLDEYKENLSALMTDKVEYLLKRYSLKIIFTSRLNAGYPDRS